MDRSLRTRITCIGVAFLAVATLAMVEVSEAAAAQRGIVDNRLEIAWPIDLTEVSALAHEIGSERLGAKWTRIIVHWTRLQPSAPGEAYAGDTDGDGYDDSYVTELRTVVGALTANGVNVILTPMDTPEWASDRSVWLKHYMACYPPDIDDETVRVQFSRMAAFLAKEFGPRARYLEVWNEPNMGGAIAPQTLSDDRYFAARTYLKMLKRFYAAAKAANPRAVVIGGATSPRGGNDQRSTSPQRFARFLRAQGAQRYFDAYSHHPYACGRPQAKPGDRRRAVLLGNLSVLLKLFPGKPFYLTEYGYATEKPTIIGYVVSETRQAAYLKQAYKYVAERYPRVKAMLWFMVQDLEPASDRDGAYMGLRRTTGTRKPAWFSFSGGNSFALKTSRAKGSKVVKIQAVLRNRALGRLAGKAITLQRRPKGRGAWRSVASRTSSRTGAVAFWTRPAKGGTFYRVTWSGVCVSAKVKLRR